MAHVHDNKILIGQQYKLHNAQELVLRTCMLATLMCYEQGGEGILFSLHTTGYAKKIQCIACLFI